MAADTVEDKNWAETRRSDPARLRRSSRIAPSNSVAGGHFAAFSFTMYLFDTI
jgi:hypothetical protein